MRTGRCNNFDDPCPNFVSKKVIEVPEGAEFNCPECQRELIAVAPAPGLGARFRAVPPAVKIAAVVVPLFALVGFGAYTMLGAGEPEVTTEVAAESTLVLPVADSALSDAVVFEKTASNATGDSAKPQKPPVPPVSSAGTVAKRPSSQPAAPVTSAPKQPDTQSSAGVPPNVAVTPTTTPASPPPAATAPPDTATRAVVPAPPPETRATRTLARNTDVLVRPARKYCLAELKRNGLMSLVLANPVPLSDGSSLPAGTEMIGRIVAREASDTPDEPDRLRLALASLTNGGENVGLSSGQLALQMRRQSGTGRVVKYSIIGAVIGGVGAALLKQNPVVGVAIGGGGGAVVGVITAANQDACFVAEQTILPFRLTQDVSLR